MPKNLHTLPWKLYRQIKLNKKMTKKSKQMLEGVLEKLPEVKVYMHKEATQAVAQLIACDDQVHVMVVHVEIELMHRDF
jgi:hypothetical protein